jgi:hypothetical protein
MIFGACQSCEAPPLQSPYLEIVIAKSLFVDKGIDLQKHIFPSASSSMKSTFPWMQRHYVNYYKGEQLYETNRRETALAHPRG